MPRTQIWFDGHCITDEFYVSNLAMQVASRTVKTQNIAGRDGVMLTGVQLQPITITMQINALHDTKAERIAALDMLAGWLDVDEPKQLSFSFDDGKYYLAVPSKIGNRKRWKSADALLSVSFYCPDPVRYGESHTVSVSSGGSSTINVGGTYPTVLDIDASAAKRDSSTQYWGASLDSQKTIKVSTGSASGVTLDIDTAKRDVKVAGALVLPTLDSDWFDKVNPGSHVVSSVLGTGAFTVSWVDRWV